MARKKLFTALITLGVLLLLTPLVLRLMAEPGPGLDAAPPDYFPVQDPATGLWGYIDSEGTLAVPMIFDWAGDFRHGRGLVESDGMMGYIDSGFKKQGDWAIAPRFKVRDESDMPAHGFANGLALARDPATDKWGYLATDGSWAIEPSFDEIIYFPDIPPVGDFSDGLAWVQRFTIQPRNVTDANGKLKLDEADRPIKEDHPIERWGYIDMTGKVAIDFKYQGAQDFSEGLAAVRQRTHDAWGFIDRSGKTAITPQFAGVGRFSEGLCPAQLGEVWGFIDTEGEWAIDARFAEVRGFSDGLAPAREDGKWGYIDTTGQWVIYPRFDGGDGYNSSIDARPFEAGLARVVENGQVLYIDTDGQTVWPR